MQSKFKVLEIKNSLKAQCNINVIYLMSSLERITEATSLTIPKMMAAR